MDDVQNKQHLHAYCLQNSLIITTTLNFNINVTL
jgi:hypothetical protein